MGSRRPARPGIGLEQDARARDGELVSLAAHGLDQHGHLQLAPPGDLAGVLLGALGHADGDIAFGLSHQPRADFPRGQLVAVLPGERRIVDREGERERRRIDGPGRQRAQDLGRGQRVGDRRRLEARHRHDVARGGALDRHAVQAPEGEQAGRPGALDDAFIGPERMDLPVGADFAALDPAR